MAVTTNRNRTGRQRDERPFARRREMVEGLVLLGVLVALAVVARLPTG